MLGLFIDTLLDLIGDLFDWSTDRLIYLIREAPFDIFRPFLDWVIICAGGSMRVVKIPIQGLVVMSLAVTISSFPFWDFMSCWCINSISYHGIMFIIARLLLLYWVSYIILISVPKGAETQSWGIACWFFYESSSPDYFSTGDYWNFPYYHPASRTGVLGLFGFSYPPVEDHEI